MAKSGDSRRRRLTCNALVRGPEITTQNRGNDQQQVAPKGNRRVRVRTRSKETEQFKLTRVLPLNASPADVFTGVGRPVLDWLRDGFDANIISYGQAGAGKTSILWGAREASQSHQQEGLVIPDTSRVADGLLKELLYRVYDYVPRETQVQSHESNGRRGFFNSDVTPQAALRRGNETQSNPWSGVEISAWEIAGKKTTDLLGEYGQASQAKVKGLSPLLSGEIKGANNSGDLTSIDMNIEDGGAVACKTATSEDSRAKPLDIGWPEDDFVTIAAPDFLTALEVLNTAVRNTTEFKLCESKSKEGLASAASALGGHVFVRMSLANSERSKASTLHVVDLAGGWEPPKEKAAATSQGKCPPHATKRAPTPYSACVVKDANAFEALVRELACASSNAIIGDDSSSQSNNSGSDVAVVAGDNDRVCRDECDSDAKPPRLRLGDSSYKSKGTTCTRALRPLLTGNARTWMIVSIGGNARGGVEAARHVLNVSCCAEQIIGTYTRHSASTPSAGLSYDTTSTGDGVCSHATHGQSEIADDDAVQKTAEISNAVVRVKGHSVLPPTDGVLPSRGNNGKPLVKGQGIGKDKEVIERKPRTPLPEADYLPADSLLPSTKYDLFGPIELDGSLEMATSKPRRRNDSLANLGSVGGQIEKRSGTSLQGTVARTEVSEEPPLGVRKNTVASPRGAENSVASACASALLNDLDRLLKDSTMTEAAPPERSTVAGDVSSRQESSDGAKVHAHDQPYAGLVYDVKVDGLDDGKVHLAKDESAAWPRVSKAEIDGVISSLLEKMLPNAQSTQEPSLELVSACTNLQRRCEANVSKQNVEAVEDSASLPHRPSAAVPDADHKSDSPGPGASRDELTAAKDHKHLHDSAVLLTPVEVLMNASAVWQAGQANGGGFPGLHTDAGKSVLTISSKGEDGTEARIERGRGSRGKASRNGGRTRGKGRSADKNTPKSEPTVESRQKVPAQSSSPQQVVEVDLKGLSTPEPLAPTVEMLSAATAATEPRGSRFCCEPPKSCPSSSPSAVLPMPVVPLQSSSEEYVSAKDTMASDDKISQRSCQNEGVATGFQPGDKKSGDIGGPPDVPETPLRERSAALERVVEERKERERWLEKRLQESEADGLERTMALEIQLDGLRAELLAMGGRLRQSQSSTDANQVFDRYEADTALLESENASLRRRNVSLEMRLVDALALLSNGGSGSGDGSGSGNASLDRRIALGALEYPEAPEASPDRTSCVREKGNVTKEDKGMQGDNSKVQTKFYAAELRDLRQRLREAETSEGKWRAEKSALQRRDRQCQAQVRMMHQQKLKLVEFARREKSYEEELVNGRLALARSDAVALENSEEIKRLRNSEASLMRDRDSLLMELAEERRKSRRFDADRRAYGHIRRFIEQHAGGRPPEWNRLDDTYANHNVGTGVVYDGWGDDETVEDTARRVFADMTDQCSASGSTTGPRESPLASRRLWSSERGRHAAPVRMKEDDARNIGTGRGTKDSSRQGERGWTLPRSGRGHLGTCEP